MIGCTIFLMAERVHEFRLWKKAKQSSASERCDRNLNIYTVETLPLKPQRQCGFEFQLVSQRHFLCVKSNLQFFFPTTWFVNGRNVMRLHQPITSQLFAVTRYIFVAEWAAYVY